MEHYDVLNAILATDCPRDSWEFEGRLFKLFEFEVHCAIIKIIAELVSTVDTIQYKIVKFEVI